jgi:DNA-binding beta-propeller fold protein YncE
MLSPTVAADPYRLYVPESAGTGIDVIDPSADRVVARYATGLDPQHVVPSYDLRTLYVTNDLANTLTPVDPATGRISGPNIPVDDPYNLYFAPGGRQALVMAETRERIDFYDLPGFHIAKRLHLSCPGLNHADFSADGSFMVVSCEFGARLVKVDLKTETAVGYLSLRGSSPQDVRLDDTGRTFWVADMNHAGVHLIDAATFRQVAFIPTGRDATGSTPAATAPTCTSPTAAPEASA